MQQVSSCVPTGVFFCQSDEAKWKKPLTPQTHTQTHKDTHKQRHTRTHSYLVKYLQNTEWSDYQMITYSVSTSSIFCWCCCTLQDNNSVFSDPQSAAFSANSLL